MSGSLSELEARRRRALRALSLFAGGLAAAIAAIGFCPGYELRRGVQAAEVLPVASSPIGLAAVMVIAAGLAAAVWRRPALGHALLGSLSSIGVAVFLLTLTAAPVVGPDDSVIALPAAATSDHLVLALVSVQIALVPLACGLHAAAAYARRGERLARAHVHRLGR